MGQRTTIEGMVMTTQTFKEYLIELDRSDFALQQQHGKMPATARQQQQGMQVQPQGNDFKNKMQGSTPVVGDIIQNKAGQSFKVVSNKMGVLQVETPKGKVIPVADTLKLTPQGEQNGIHIFAAQ